MLEAARSWPLGPDRLEWIDWAIGLAGEQSEQLRQPPESAAALADRLRQLADRAHRQAMAMDFSFLYDSERKLFSIGYQEASHTRDSSFYDLLASEARLASFIAIAKSDVPVDHWFRLGRSLVHAGGDTALVSWSGSMFEYLMPPLVMQSYPFTLLDQTHRSAVRRQISYAPERRVPWGVSESAYNLRDRHFTYQYRAFGVPGSGAQARAGPGPGGRPVCLHAGDDGPPAARAGEPDRRSSGWGRWGPTASATPSTTPAPERASATPSWVTTWPITSG